MRPMLKPALRRLWRDHNTLQLGLDPDRAIILAGVDRASARLVHALDGTRDRQGVLATASELGIDASRATSLLDLLAREGALDDAATDRRPLFTLGREERDRLQPDLASLSLMRRTPDGGIATLAQRRAATVAAHGAGRVGASVVNLLAAAGVGRVLVADPTPARLADVCPAGFGATEVGARRDDAARRRMRRLFPATRASQSTSQRHPDLVILAPDDALDLSLRDGLVRAGVPHLYATVRETTGIVGPLVIPGSSSCLRCHDLYRRDRDPAWPTIAAQLATRDTTATACDTVLATTVAAHAALQALAFLDGDQPSTIDGTLEISLPDGGLRRRSWMPHPCCGCSWSQEE